MRVYIVRHTSVVLDGNYVCYGYSDIDVRSTFVEEATLTRKALEGLCFDGVFSSPLKRARKLAAFCGYPDPITDDRLKEMNFGDWEGRPWNEIIINEGTEEFFMRYIDQPTPGGESRRMQYERVSHFLMEKRAEGYQQILIFCHGGVINCARALAGLCQLEEAYATIPAFGSVTELDFDFLDLQ